MKTLYQHQWLHRYQILIYKIQFKLTQYMRQHIFQDLQFKNPINTIKAHHRSQLTNSSMWDYLMITNAPNVDNLVVPLQFQLSNMIFLVTVKTVNMQQVIILIALHFNPSGQRSWVRYPRYSASASPCVQPCHSWVTSLHFMSRNNLNYLFL